MIDGGSHDSIESADIQVQQTPTHGMNISRLVFLFVGFIRVL